MIAGSYGKYDYFGIYMEFWGQFCLNCRILCLAVVCRTTVLAILRHTWWFLHLPLRLLTRWPPATSTATVTLILCCLTPQLRWARGISNIVPAQKNTLLGQFVSERNSHDPFLKNVPKNHYGRHIDTQMTAITLDFQICAWEFCSVRKLGLSGTGLGFVLQ